MLAELVDHVIGVDPDRDWITAAVVDANTTGVVAKQRFSADAVGYDEAISPPATAAIGGAPKARPTARSDAASSATSHAESGASSNPHMCSKPPLDRHRRLGPNRRPCSGILR